MCKVNIHLIVKMKELSWKARAVPANAALRIVSFKETHWQSEDPWCLLWHFYWNWEVPRWAIQVSAQEKCKTCQTCTQKGSNSSAGCFPWGNQKFVTTWNPWISQICDWMGEQFCDCGKESSMWIQQFSLTWTYSEEETANMPRSERLKWSFGKGTILHMFQWGNYWKISWNEMVYHCWL